MKYNFETISKRYNTGSKKWQEMADNGVSEKEDIVPFSVADMEFETAPEIREALKNEIDHYVLGYANPTPAYLKAVCDWQKKRHNWEAKPEWVCPSHGVVDAFFDAVKIYTRPGDGVMLMTPTYYPMYHAIQDNGRLLVDSPLKQVGDSYEVDWEDFDAKAAQLNTKMLILCSPHNPTGRVWKREELEHISRVCLANHVLVVSDEIHDDLIMPGYHHIVYASLSPEAEQNCLVLTAPSKTFNLAGLQTSNIFIPNAHLRGQYMDYLKQTNANPKCNILGYIACQAAYEHCADWLDQAIEVIHTNEQLVRDFLGKNFPQIKVKKLEATYLLWMDWNGLGIDYHELERINHQEARVFFDEGYVFGAQGEGYERWNLAAPTRYIREALDRLKTAYDAHLNH